MSAYEDAVDAMMATVAKYRDAIRETNRMQERVIAAEIDFLNAVDEQRGAFQDWAVACERMRKLEPKAEVS